nr:hypothetical protein [Burkholderia pyrrocinia]
MKTHIKDIIRHAPVAITSPGPIYAFNVSAMTLTNVTIAGQAVNTTITDKR